MSAGQPGTSCWRRTSRAQRRLRSLFTDRHSGRKCPVCRVRSQRDYTQVELSIDRHDSNAADVVARLRVSGAAAVPWWTRPGPVTAVDYTASVAAASQAAQVEEVAQEVGVVVDARSLRLLSRAVFRDRESLGSVSRCARRLHGVHRACYVSVRGASAALSLRHGRRRQLRAGLRCGRVVVARRLGQLVGASSAPQVGAAGSAVGRAAVSLVLPGAERLSPLRHAPRSLRCAPPRRLDRFSLDLRRYLWGCHDNSGCCDH